MHGWSDETKLILISTQIEVVAEVDVELGNNERDFRIKKFCDFDILSYFEPRKLLYFA